MSEVHRIRCDWSGGCSSETVATYHNNGWKPKDGSEWGSGYHHDYYCPVHYRARVSSERIEKIRELAAIENLVVLPRDAAVCVVARRGAARAAAMIAAEMGHPEIGVAIVEKLG